MSIASNLFPCDAWCMLSSVVFMHPPEWLRAAESRVAKRQSLPLTPALSTTIQRFLHEHHGGEHAWRNKTGRIEFALQASGAMTRLSTSDTGLGPGPRPGFRPQLRSSAPVSGSGE